MIKIASFIIMLGNSQGHLFKYPDDIPEMTREQCKRVSEIINTELEMQRAMVSAICIPRVEGLY